MLSSASGPRAPRARVGLRVAPPPRCAARRAARRAPRAAARSGPAGRRNLKAAREGPRGTGAARPDAQRRAANRGPPGRRRARCLRFPARWEPRTMLALLRARISGRYACKSSPRPLTARPRRGTIIHDIGARTAVGYGIHAARAARDIGLEAPPRLMCEISRGVFVCPRQPYDLDKQHARPRRPGASTRRPARSAGAAQRVGPGHGPPHKTAPNRRTRAG